MCGGCVRMCALRVSTYSNCLLCMLCARTCVFGTSHLPQQPVDVFETLCENTEARVAGGVMVLSNCGSVRIDQNSFVNATCTHGGKAIDTATHTRCSGVLQLLTPDLSTWLLAD